MPLWTVRLRPRVLTMLIGRRQSVMLSIRLRSNLLRKAVGKCSKLALHLNPGQFNLTNSMSTSIVKYHLVWTMNIIEWLNSLDFIPIRMEKLAYSIRFGHQFSCFLFILEACELYSKRLCLAAKPAPILLRAETPTREIIWGLLLQAHHPTR